MMKRNDDDQMPQETPGQTALRVATALAMILLSIVLFIALIGAIIGGWHFIQSAGIWLVLGVLAIGGAIWQGPRIHTHIEAASDRRAVRERENKLNDAQVEHLKAKTVVLTRRIEMDERGNAALMHGGQVIQLSGNSTELPAGIQNLHNHHHIVNHGTSVREEKQEPLALPKATVPTGRQLLLNGAVEQALAEGKLILGPQDNGQLETLAIKRCFSTLISGLPAAGKTTTVFWIAGQLVVIGARLWVVDPHLSFQDEEGNRSLGAELYQVAVRERTLMSALRRPCCIENSLLARNLVLEALADAFVFPPCDDDPQQVIPRVRWMYKELCKRQQPGYIVRAQDTIIGIMDEFNTVASSIDPTLALVQHEQQRLNFGQTLALLEREGRKFGLHFMLIGHKWARQDIGGDNAVRTNATTYLCHMLNDQRQADLLLGSGQGKKMLELAVGQYLITGSAWNRPVTKITTPMISAVDLPLLLQIKQRGVQVRNAGNIIESTALADLPMKKDFPESLQEFTDEAWTGVGTHDDDDPPIIPLRPKQPQGPLKATIADAIAVWNELGEIGRYRLRDELIARDLFCSEDMARAFIREMRARLEDAQ